MAAGSPTRERARLISRTRTGPGHGKDQCKGFIETDYARFSDAAHQQPGDLPIQGQRDTEPSKSRTRPPGGTSRIKLF